MNLTSEERKVMVCLEIEKSDRFFEQAEKNASIGEWDVVANRLYYSLFHAVSAILIYDGHQVGSHKGAVMMFGQHYVRSGVFTADEGRFYSQLQTMREKADYNVAWQSTEDVTKPLIEPVRAFLAKIKLYVQSFIGDNNIPFCNNNCEVI